MASLLVAARNPRVGAVASLDGSDEMWRDVITGHPDFSAAQFATPYLRVCKPRSANEPDEGFFDSLSYAPTVRLILDARVQHFEVVSSGLVTLRLRGAPERDDRERVFALVSRAVRAFFDGRLRGDPAAARLLGSEAELRAISPLLIAVEKRPGADAPPDDPTFLRLVAEQGWDAARAVYERWIAKDPRTFSAARMVRIGEMLLWTGRYDEAAIAILQLAARRFPESARAQEMLGNVYYWNRGQPDTALPHYREALRLNPGSLQVKIYLEQIAGRPD
jgi:tetratricopeptide (TPR) repeat protein